LSPDLEEQGGHRDEQEHEGEASHHVAVSQGARGAGGAGALGGGPPGGGATTPSDHREHEQLPEHKEEEEDHQGEQATTLLNLEEVGKHREQGTVAWSMPTERDHREEQGEQGGHRGLVTRRAPWPHRRVKNWRSKQPHHRVAGRRVVCAAFPGHGVHP
jgi:hypothetical protein